MKKMKGIIALIITFTMCLQTMSYCVYAEEIDVGSNSDAEVCEHDYSDAPKWTWNEDGSVTATFICSKDNEHIEQREAVVVSEVTKSATEDETGERTYTATVTFEGKEYTDIKIEEIPKSNHTHTMSVVEAKEATCTEDGNIAYYYCDKCDKYFSDAEGQIEIDSASIVKKATGHKYGEPEWSWDGYESAVAKFTCENDEDHTETVEAKIESEETKEATEDEAGIRTYTATVTFDGKDYTTTKTEEIAKLKHQHTLKAVNAKKPTCTKAGNIAYYYCSGCGKYYSDSKATKEIKKEDTVIAKIAHKGAAYFNPKSIKWSFKCKVCQKIIYPMTTSKSIISRTKASIKNNGKIIYYSSASYRDKTGKKHTYVYKGTKYKDVIYKAAKVSLQTSSYVYDGKTKKPKLVVKDSKGRNISTSHYTVKYASGRKNVGKYKVTVLFKNNYYGTINLYFKIIPKGTSLNFLAGKSRSIYVKWRKYTTQVSGYQIQYSTSKNFRSGTKTITVTSNKKTSYIKKSLKKNTRYYVRIRTYKKVSKTKYYSKWSSVMSVITK